MNSHPIMNIELAKLLVNHKNYRFKDPAIDQQEAMLSMLEAQKEKIIELAKHIANNGLNPTKRLLVKETNDGKYVVLEGNRRITVLKLMTNPNEIPGSYRFKSTFEDLHAKYKDSVPTTVECVVYAEGQEEIAKEWINLEHTGENKGRGTVPWDSAQKRGLKSRHTKELSPLVQVLEFLEAKGINISGIQATNLERLIGTTIVRKYLGINFENKKLVLTASEREVIQRFRKIIERMSAKDFGVSDIYTAEQRQELIKDVLSHEPSVLPSVPAFPEETSVQETSTPPPVSPPVNITNTNTNENNANTTIQNTIAPASHSSPNPELKDAVRPSPKTPNPSNGDTNSSQPAVSNGHSNTPPSPQPSSSPLSSTSSNNQNSYQTLINPAKLLPSTTPEKITEIYKELQTVNISGSKAAPHAVGALLRILLEITAKEYLTKAQQFFHDKNGHFRNPAESGKQYSELRDKLNYIANQSGLQSDIAQMLKVLIADQLITPTLNQVMHSTLFSASGTAIKDLWKNLEKVFDHLINEMQ